MSLCIAAVCDHTGNKEPKIVMCADLHGKSEGVGASEAEDRLGFVRKGWAALVAGTISRADELLGVYAEYLSKYFTEISEFNLVEHLRKPAHIQKENLIDEFLQQTYAFDRKYFYREGVEKFPDTFTAQVTTDIKNIKLDASLIIAGFVKQEYLPNGSSEYGPFLSLIDEEQSSLGALKREFAAIGSGTSTALSSLYRRKQESTDSLEKTLYNVYEANRLSEQVPGMGKNFLAMYVLYQTGDVREMTEAGYLHLRKLYAAYGPREIKKPGALDLKDEFFADLP